MTISSRDRSSHALLAICAALSALFSLAMLHRWEVSPLGIKSYGRVWFYYVSYTDFGFTRRALVGTLLTISRVNQLVTNPYVFAYIVHSIAIAVLVALLVGVFVRNQSRAHPLLLLVTFFSPVLVIQSGYNTGSLDIYLLIVMVLCLFYARSTAVFTAGLVVGSLVAFRLGLVGGLDLVFARRSISGLLGGIVALGFRCGLVAFHRGFLGLFGRLGIVFAGSLLAVIFRGRVCRFLGDGHGGDGAPEPLVASRQQNVPHEGVDRGTRDDADPVEVLVQGGHPAQVDTDDDTSSRSSMRRTIWATCRSVTPLGV